MINVNHSQEVELEIDLEELIEDNSHECIDYFIDNHGEVVMEKLLDNQMAEVVDEIKERGVDITNPDYTLNGLEEHFGQIQHEMDSPYRKDLVNIMFKHFKKELVNKLFDLT